jgi:hypothetical protein
VLLQILYQIRRTDGGCVYHPCTIRVPSSLKFLEFLRFLPTNNQQLAAISLVSSA